MLFCISSHNCWLTRISLKVLKENFVACQGDFFFNGLTFLWRELEGELSLKLGTEHHTGQWNDSKLDLPCCLLYS